MNLYLNLILKEIPRLLSLLDRIKTSPTYGCFDRQYWKYKTRDYNNSRMQESAYTLALLYNYKSKNNIFYKKQEIKNLAIAACEFWASRQHRNGSFDEYLYNEKSHVATAFSSLTIINTYFLLKLKNKKILKALEKAAYWLSKNHDLVVINHDAACIPFFYLMYKITSNKKYLNYLKIKLKKVINHQNKEGWFEEYEGADIGYQSYSIYYLAKYYELSKDKRILDSLKKAIKFFSYFIHPDGTIGGLYGSRDTNFIIPAGFEILAGKIKYAAEIATEIRKSLLNKKIPGPYSFDDRFIAEESYVYLDFKFNVLKPKLKLPKKQTNFKIVFNKCGLCVIKNKKQYLIINLKKSGIGKLFKGDKLIEELGTYEFKKKKKDKIVYSTYGLSKFKDLNNKIIIKSNFYKYKIRQINTIPLIILKLANMVCLSAILKRLIRFFLIKKIKKTRYSFYRTISITNNIKIKDSLDNNIKQKTTKETNFSPIYSTSVGFYH